MSEDPQLCLWCGDDPEGCGICRPPEDELARALRDLRDAVAHEYKAGRIPAEPFVRAGNVLARYAELLARRADDL